MEYTLYKPTKKGSGGAFKFNIHNSGKFSFLKGAPQIAPMGGDKVFGWTDDKSINVKMSMEDLGAILSVIFKFNPGVSLYHQTPKDNKIIEFKHVPDRKGFSLKVSRKTNDGQQSQVFAGLSYQEAMVLKVYCETVLSANLRNANRQD